MQATSIETEHAHVPLTPHFTHTAQLREPHAQLLCNRGHIKEKLKALYKPPTF